MWAGTLVNQLVNLLHPINLRFKYNRLGLFGNHQSLPSTFSPTSGALLR